MVIDILYVLGLIALLYVLLWYIDHPWEFPLQKRSTRVRKAREWLERVEEGRANWPGVPRLGWGYPDSVRRRYLQ